MPPESLSLTPEQRSLTRRYFAYKALTNFWFLSSVWLYFYRLYITDQQIGILDGMAFAIGLLAEVPSGALADRFGRDKMVKIGQLLAGSGFLIQAFGSSFVPFFVGQAIVMVGVSFVSGADEALFFKAFNFERTSTEWRKLLTRGSQIALFVSLAANIGGGFLHTIDPRIPWILTGIAFLASIIAIWSIADPRPLRNSTGFWEELREYLTSTKTGFLHFMSPKLLIYVPIILTVQGLFYTAGWGVLRIMLLDRFHFDPFLGSVAIGTSSLITIGALGLLHRHAESMSESRMFILVSLMSIAGLLLSVADIGMWGYVVILMLYAGEHTLYPYMSEVLNKHAEEKDRATVLSVASFLRTLPYVILAPVIGYLNTHDNLEYFLIVWSVLILASLLLYRKYSLPRPRTA
jgi:MFS family permease